MVLQDTHRYAGVALSLVALLGMSACTSQPQPVDSESETAGQSTPATETGQTISEVLTAKTESGAAQFLSGWSIEGDGWSQKVTTTYDDAGNKTKETVESTLEDSSSGESVSQTSTNTWTYDSDNAPQTMEVTSEVNGEQAAYSLQYNPATYEDDVVTFTGQTEDTDDTTGISSTVESDYTYKDGAIVSYETATLSDIQGNNVSLNAIIAFNDDGTVQSYTSDMDESDEAIPITYSGNTATVGKDTQDSWTLTQDANGLITKAVNDATGVTMTFSYSSVSAPTDFNRAVAVSEPGSAFVTGILSRHASTAALEAIDATGEQGQSTNG